jgi:hypothetical protein
LLLTRISSSLRNVFLIDESGILCTVVISSCFLFRLRYLLDFLLPWVTRRVQHVAQELLTLPEYLHLFRVRVSHLYFSAFNHVDNSYFLVMCFVFLNLFSILYHILSNGQNNYHNIPNNFHWVNNEPLEERVIWNEQKLIRQINRLFWFCN